MLRLGSQLRAKLPGDEYPLRNSIIPVDVSELRLARGMPLGAAVIDAGAVRFRPMTLTAAAMVVGSPVILFGSWAPAITEVVFDGCHVSQPWLCLAAAFCWAFFCRRGNRDLFFFWSFGTFCDFVCGFGGAGSAAAATGAFLPAGFALAAESAPLVSASIGFLRSLGFCSSAMIPSKWR